MLLMILFIRLRLDMYTISLVVTFHPSCDTNSVLLMIACRVFVFIVLGLCLDPTS